MIANAASQVRLVLPARAHHQRDGWVFSPVPMSASRCSLRRWRAMTVAVIGSSANAAARCRSSFRKIPAKEGWCVPLSWRQAAYLTFAIAEYFRHDEKDVLCLTD